VRPDQEETLSQSYRGGQDSFCLTPQEQPENARGGIQQDIDGLLEKAARRKSTDLGNNVLLLCQLLRSRRVWNHDARHALRHDRYEDGKKKPNPEGGQGRRNGALKEETTTLAPLSPYGTGKLAGERYGMQMSDYYGFDFAALRYFNTFGTRQTFTPYVGVITIFITALLHGRRPVIFGSGEQTRDFIHVEDVAEANVLMMSSSVNRAVINVGTGQGTRVVDIARLLIERINKDITPEYAEAQKGEPEDSVADVTAMKEILGFTPKTTLQDKIDTLIDWNRATLAKSF